MEELLTPREVAQRLKLSPRTIVNWLQTGRLRGIKVGKSWRVREGDLASFLAEEQMPAPWSRGRGRPEDGAAD